MQKKKIKVTKKFTHDVKSQIGNPNEPIETEADEKLDLEEDDKEYSTPQNSRLFSRIDVKTINGMKSLIKRDEKNTQHDENTSDEDEGRSDKNSQGHYDENYGGSDDEIN